MGQPTPQTVPYSPAQSPSLLGTCFASAQERYAVYSSASLPLASTCTTCTPHLCTFCGLLSGLGLKGQPPLSEGKSTLEGQRCEVKIVVFLSKETIPNFFLILAGLLSGEGKSGVGDWGGSQEQVFSQGEGMLPSGGPAGQHLSSRQSPSRTAIPAQTDISQPVCGNKVWISPAKRRKKNRLKGCKMTKNVIFEVLKLWVFMSKVWLKKSNLAGFGRICLFLGYPGPAASRLCPHMSDVGRRI